jgi:hypothetical protein
VVVYTKLFPKRMGKDTKSLLSDMKVSWYKFQPGNPEYKQEASEHQSNFSTCDFITQIKRLWCSRVNKYNNFITTKIIYYFNNKLRSAVAQLHHFLPEPLNISFLCVYRKFNVKCFRNTNALLSYLPYVPHVQPIPFFLSTKNSPQHFVSKTFSSCSSSALTQKVPVRIYYTQ